MHGAALLDFDLGLTEVPPSFPVGFPTPGGVPNDVSDCELGNSDFQDQMEGIISLTDCSNSNSTGTNVSIQTEIITSH